MFGRFNSRDPFRNYTSESFHTTGHVPAPIYEPDDEDFASTESRVDRVLNSITSEGYSSLGEFLLELFANPSSGSISRSLGHAQTVSRFLGGRTLVGAKHLVDRIYNHKDSHPRAHHQTPAENMARGKLFEWAVEVVESEVDREARSLAGKHGGLRLLRSLTWDAVRSFSLANVHDIILRAAPTTLRLLSNIAMTKNKQEEPPEMPGEHSRASSSLPSDSLPQQHSEAASAAEGHAARTQGKAQRGSGKNRRNPWVIIIVTLLMLLNARNLQFTAFQKLIGVWLFANGASVEVFSVLSRVGLSVAYTTTLRILQDLTASAKRTVRQQAARRAVMVVYDNINRMRRVWNPDLGQKDTMESGTAATLVVLDACEDPCKALDLAALRQAHEDGRRKALTVDHLRDRINWQHAAEVMAVHTAMILVQDTPELTHLHDDLNKSLRTSLAIRRMKNGRRTTVFPLATSSHEENSAKGNRSVLDDLVLGQLGLTKEKAASLLMLIGGDQATVEKVRTLKRLLACCPHGYDAYDWVLPIIQLWHMGWSDLERILETHWGSDITDASTLSFMNEHLGRKVKNVKRPDFYPAQALVFDTLRSDILDCWREYLKTENLSAHFKAQHQISSADEIVRHAREIVQRYMSVMGYEAALSDQYAARYFPVGSDWPAKDDNGSAADHAPRAGDQVLANTILRMRDSMTHFEFQSAVADGDIGRVMNVIRIWVFSFCGSGRSKYTNELLELICSLDFEFSDELAAVVLDHWLCNLTGFDGCWFPLDLLQEHGNRQLKSLTKERVKAFGDSYFKNIISYNIRYFLDVKDTLRSILGLGGRGGAHKKKKKIVAMRRIAELMRERELHRFRKGRVLSHKARDDFQEGYRIFDETTKLQDCIARTLSDRTHIHEESADVNMDSEDDEDNSSSDEETPLPMPNIWHSGSLLQGDESDSDSDDEEQDVDAEFD